MAVSFGMLGILLMLDICFVVNCFLVRALRDWTTQKTRQEALVAATAVEVEEKKHSSDIILNNFQGVVDMVNDTLKQNQDLGFAWVLGTVKLDPMPVKKFPGWRPIPNNFGICSTCIFITMATMLLSPDLVTDQLGVLLATLDADLCVTEARKSGVIELQKELSNMTNLDVARKQHLFMSEFHAALVNDTALYDGVSPHHECPTSGDITGYKSDWTQSNPFFPGYCKEGLEAAIDAAQSRECVDEICNCPTLLDSPVFDVTGLAGKKFCGEVCISVPYYACPKHTADEEHDLQERQDYRWHQYEFAEKRRANMTNAFPTVIPPAVASTATQTAEKILHQIDAASYYLYIAYQCLALFFPSPLILFRMPVWTGVKRLLFGVQKIYFICFVVAIWWGVEYFRGIWYSPDIRLFVNNLRAGDPCFVDADYLLERQMTLNEIREEIMPMGPIFRASAMTAVDVLREVKYFAESCSCPFPDDHVSQITQAFMANASNIGFNVTMDICNTNSDDRTLYTPPEDITFFGNTSICTNGTAARRLVFKSAPETETDWWDLWVGSVFLATIVVKFAVANYGLSLMALVDSFVVCAGEFLWVPTDLGMEIKTDEGVTEHVKFLEAFDERGRALPTEMLEKWFNSKK